MNFESFTKEKNLKIRNAWLKEPGLSIYVRRPFVNNHIHDADYELATIEAMNPGHKALTKFMDKYHERYKFYIENILEKRLISFFEKYGYRILNTPEKDILPCMIANGCFHIRDIKEDEKIEQKYIF